MPPRPGWWCGGRWACPEATPWRAATVAATRGPTRYVRPRDTPTDLVCRSSAFASKQRGASLRYVPPDFMEPLHDPAIGMGTLYHEQTDGSPMRHKGRRSLHRYRQCLCVVFLCPPCLSRSAPLCYAAVTRAHRVACMSWASAR